ncbi:MAG: DUF433 domain-containing protein [Gemmataceae bacterium]|nr:DUF433 domain-containing protein [Gemmataceae bacterium]
MRHPSAAKQEKAREPVEVGKHLIVDPRVCFGQLTFKGTRVPVETVLLYLAKGRTIDQLLEGWPELTQDAIVEAIRLAAAALVKRYTPEVEATYEPDHSG